MIVKSPRPGVIKSYEPEPSTEQRQLVYLFIAAVLLYLPGIWWGLPYATSAETMRPWGSDEIAPFGALGELHNVFIRHRPPFNPQYPLFHYFIQALFCAPYALWLWLTGGLSQPVPAYPFGLAEPIHALATFTLLSRLPSLLMAAAVVLVAYHTALLIGGRRTAILGALVVLLLYPMFYYSKTSNVDVGALLWTALGLMMLAAIFRDGLDKRRAVLLGVFAALAAGTKDASAFAFISAAIILVPWHLRHAKGTVTARLQPLMIGLATAVLAYAIASGFVFSPRRYFFHLEWLSGTTSALVYPASFAGYFATLRETTGEVVSALGLPAALAMLSGVLLCLKRERRNLWLLVIAGGIVAATILPVRYVKARFVFIVAYTLSFYAAIALNALFESKRDAIRRLAVPATLVVVLWSLVRGLDLTQQMIRDGRYALGDWLRENARAGEKVAYFSVPQKLPALPEGIRTVPDTALCSRQDWVRVAPEFVLIIPQQHYDIPHEWSLRKEIYGSLVNGSLGYRRVAIMQARSISSRRAIPFVNPPIQVFVRNDRVAQLKGFPPQRREALLAGVEARLGLEPRIPPGLIRNPNPRSTSTCQGVAW